MKGRAVCNVLLFVWPAIALLAQTDRGTITGTVKDATGAVVPIAQVIAVSRSTGLNYKTTTTASGDFTVPSLPAESYQFKVESPGFKIYARDNVEVPAGATLR